MNVNEIVSHSITNSKTKLPKGFGGTEDAWKQRQLREIARKQKATDKAVETLERSKKAKEQPTSDRLPCLCGCGLFPSGKKSRFVPGHDGRIKGLLLVAARNGDKDAEQRLIDLGWGKFI